MTIKTVGILSPGDMGSAIANVLHEGGLDIVTCLEGRGDLSRLRAQESGIRDVPTYDDLVREVDILLSVLVPVEAVPVAERVAQSLRATGATPTYVDLNAIAPHTVRTIAGIVIEAGAPFVDGGIIGSPPRPGGGTRVYLSGPDLTVAMQLGDHGLNARAVGLDIGQASGLKMVYAASTKGTTALWTELLAAARALNLEEALTAELEESSTYEAQVRGIPTMPRRSRRWVGEMEEIAATFESLGLTPHILQGAAEMYRLIGRTSLGDQTSRDPDPSLETILDTLNEEAGRE